jgi:hypothetical protein
MEENEVPLTAYGVQTGCRAKNNPHDGRVNLHAIDQKLPKQQSKGWVHGGTRRLVIQSQF